MLSNPIVTPCTDEFPTEEAEERKSVKKEDVKEKVESKTEKRALKQAKQNDSVVDYKSRKKKKAKDVGIVLA